MQKLSQISVLMGVLLVPQLLLGQSAPGQSTLTVAPGSQAPFKKAAGALPVVLVASRYAAFTATDQKNTAGKENYNVSYEIKTTVVNLRQEFVTEDGVNYSPVLDEEGNPFYGANLLWSVKMGARPEVIIYFTSVHNILSKIMGGTVHSISWTGSKQAGAPDRYSGSLSAAGELTGAAATTAIEQELQRYANLTRVPSIIPVGQILQFPEYFNNPPGIFEPPEYTVSVVESETPATTQLQDFARSTSWNYFDFTYADPLTASLSTPAIKSKALQEMQYKFVLTPRSPPIISWLEMFTPKDPVQPMAFVYQSWTPAAGEPESQPYTIDPLGLDAGDGNKTARRPAEDGEWEVVLIEPTPGVDGNHDGVITLDGADAVSSTQPFMHGPNSNHDGGQAATDAETPGVNGAADLRDFFPLYLDLKRLVTALPPSTTVKYILKQEGEALNLVYTDLRRENAYSYLTSTATNGYGRELDKPAATADTQQVTTSGINVFSGEFGSPAFLNAIATRDGGVILLEARQFSDKPLVLVVEKDGVVVARQEIPLFLAQAELAVDANRDRLIKFARENDSDKVSSVTPYRIWLNDDDDDGGDINGNDVPGSSSPDGQQVKVQGTRDLVDFFPVFLDLKQILTVLPPGTDTKYKLKQADDGLRFVYTDLSRADAFKYLNDYAIGNSLKEADAHWVIAAGYELDATWLGQVKDADKGVILVEGRNATDKPLVLFVEKADGTVIAEIKLELKIVPVETMFRHLNLHDRNLAGLVGTKEDSAQPEAMGDPTGFPDSPNSDSRWLIFVHGFNVSGQKSRGWNAEMFKRFYWSGNKSRFVGVSWFGNPDDPIGGLPSDFHLSVRNAMVTAPVLAQEINALPGTKTIVGHSLACGIISSAIADHSMTISKACFVDAALAKECFDGEIVAGADGMTPDGWKNYDSKLYAANWCKLFPSDDGRSKLTWRNRFVAASAAVHNFYASTENVLAEYTGEVPENVFEVVGTSGLSGSFGWVFQEKAKGVRENYVLGLTHLGGYYGGWGFNLTDPADATDPIYYFADGSVFGGGRRTPLTSVAGSTAPNWQAQFRRAPLFDPGYGPITGTSRAIDRSVLRGPDWIPSLYDTTADTTTGGGVAGVTAHRDQLLAEAIPAMTWPVGSHTVQAFEDRNHPLTSLVDHWPRGTLGGVPEWQHSDMREVAYLYQYRFFDQLVTLSNQ